MKRGSNVSSIVLAAPDYDVPLRHSRSIRPASADCDPCGEANRGSRLEATGPSSEDVQLAVRQPISPQPTDRTRRDLGSHDDLDLLASLRLAVLGIEGVAGLTALRGIPLEGMI
jgi:hypothetical protein